MKTLKEIFTNIYNKIFKASDFAEVGDIIWAKRYKSKKEKNNIQVGHQEGPYLIIYKNKKKNKIYGLPCTSQKNDSKWQHLYLDLDKNKYNFKKESHVHTRYEDLIKKNRYISLMAKITKEDLELLYKKMFIVQNSRYQNPNFQLPLEALKFNLTKGDIINYHETYYFIYEIDESFYYVYPVIPTTKESLFTIENKKYFLKILEKTKIAKNENVLLKDITNDEWLKLLKPNTQDKTGYLIKTVTNTYYIYGENKTNYLVYELYSNKNTQNDLKSIMLLNSKFYIDFTEKQISKKAGIFWLDRALLNEIETLKQTRKEVRKKETDNLKNFNKLLPRTIIKDEQNNRYVVLYKKENNIICCSLKTNRTEVISASSSKKYEIIGKLNNINFLELKIKHNNSKIS